MSFWKTLGKIGAIAGGGIATAMTGGAASPLLLAAIGAGTGAAVGGIDNGWKGALTGGALGAATGGIGGGATSGVKSAAQSGLKSAIGTGVKSMATSALKDPGTYLELAKDVGSVLGKQQEGKSKGKVAQATLNQQQDQNALANYIAQQNAQNTAANTDLQRKSFESSNRSTSAKQALIGALLGGGITPTSISGGQASGGLLQSLNGNPDAMAAMKILASQGSQAQNTPLQFQGGQMIAPPRLTTLPQVDDGGAGSNIANILQLLGAAGSGLSPALRKPQPPEQAPEQMAQLQNPNIYGNVRF